MHLHLEGNNCLQIIAVKGRNKEIEDLAKALVAKRGMKQLKLAVVAV
jgi:metal-responsive CopG/Arc/MetJ family transcriptional regulator